MERSMYSRPQIGLLYVEDDQVTRDIVVRMIRMKFPDLVLHAAENGKSGLDLYRVHAPQIVVTDINMPVMDGIRMAGEIKALDPDAIIIVVSAYSDSHYLMNAIDIGVNHYLLKPIDHKKLFALLERCISGIVLEGKLREQNDHIRKLSRAVEHSPSVAMITDASGIIEYVNPKFPTVTGYTSEEVIGLNPRILKSDETDPRTFGDLWSTITAGREWHGEFRNRRKDGTLFWEAASISPLFDHAGQITHYVAVKEDITRRKEAERQVELLNTDLAPRAAELEVANQEILHLCANRLDTESLGYIREIYDGTLRMSQLIQTLLKFSRVSRGEVVRNRVDLSMIANEIAAEHLLAESDRRVSFRIAEGVTADCDAALMRIVLENLIGNAWKFTARRDEAVIEFGAAGSDCTTSCFVRDNGVGFAMDEAERLFVPFHRLHHREDFEGNGIGLATVQRIIQRHGGRVWAEGEAGRGATFRFTIR
jgi:PAS domain S-box-containing protein